VRLRDLPCALHLHEVPTGEITIGEFQVSTELVCHPGPTVGYRIAGMGGVLTYLSDHEPALGKARFPDDPTWTSGYNLAVGADILIHDAQYSNAEYAARVGWGHSSVEQALAFAQLTQVRQLVLFHHDPAHNDEVLDQMTRDALAGGEPDFEVAVAQEGMSFRLGNPQGAVGQEPGL
jgi:phosphoribosyl 1,2-cyclic phosphodiesterase